jgi:hypothetical protein
LHKKQNTKDNFKGKAVRTLPPAKEVVYQGQIKFDSVALIPFIYWLVVVRSHHFSFMHYMQDKYCDAGKT